MNANKHCDSDYCHFVSLLFSATSGQNLRRAPLKFSFPPNLTVYNVLHLCVIGLHCFPFCSDDWRVVANFMSFSQMSLCVSETRFPHFEKQLQIYFYMVSTFNLFHLIDNKCILQSVVYSVVINTQDLMFTTY